MAVGVRDRESKNAPRSELRAAADDQALKGRSGNCKWRFFNEPSTVQNLRPRASNPSLHRLERDSCGNRPDVDCVINESDV